MGFFSRVFAKIKAPEDVHSQKGASDMTLGSQDVERKKTSPKNRSPKGLSSKVEEGSNGSSHSINSKSKSNPDSPKRATKSQPAKKTTSANYQTAVGLLDQVNKPVIVMEDFFALWVCPDANRQILEDGFSHSARDLVPVFKIMRDSFPDFKFTYASITETPGSKEVVIEGVQFAGTHTGAPFSPAPGVPAIPATGKCVENDEERFCLEMEDGKIKTCRVIALGCKTGMVGMYEGIGGKM